MKDLIHMHVEWPNRWFGFWRDGCSSKALLTIPGLLKLPLIDEFVDSDFFASVPGDLLLKYLTSENRILASPHSKCMFEECDCPTDLITQTGGLSSPFITDGEWLWSGTLAHYVKYHQVKIPDTMYNHICNKSFVAPNLGLPISDEVIRNLDWPWIPSMLGGRLNVQSDPFWWPKGN